MKAQIEYSLHRRPRKAPTWMLNATASDLCIGNIDRIIEELDSNSLENIRWYFRHIILF